jgi:hypothetical protein
MMRTAVFSIALIFGGLRRLLRPLWLFGAVLFEGLFLLAPQYIPHREVNFLGALVNDKQSFRFVRARPALAQR